MPATLYIVAGLPATGKTIVAQALAEHTNAPLLSKDVYKEIAFRIMSPSSREMSQAIGIFCEELMLSFIEEIVDRVEIVVAESTFRPQFLRSFSTSMRSRGVSVRVVILHTDENVRHQRFRDRAKTRHAGHFDDQYDIDVSVDYDHASWIEIGATSVYDTTVLSDEVIRDIVRDTVTQG